MSNQIFTGRSWGGSKKWLLAIVAGGLVHLLTACSSGIVPNYAYYESLTVDEIAADFKVYSKSDDDVWLSAPWMVELVGWLNEHDIVDNQAQKLSADYNPATQQLNLHAQIEYAYTVPARKDFQAAEFDRARVNDGRLLLIDPEAADQDCTAEECTYSQKIVIPLTVAEVVGSRYTGLSLQLIDPGKPVMEFRMPESYVRAFSQEVGKKLARHQMDYDRVTDVNARLENEFGRDQLTVEDMAREWQCDRTTVQALELDGPKSLFQVECGKNGYRLVRCQWGECNADGPIRQ